jgi:hypothetical protein
VSRLGPQRAASSQSDLGGSRAATSATEFQTKTQRKNQNKAAQLKAEKAEAQELQGERLAQYKREREQARMDEQHKSVGKGKSKRGSVNVAGSEKPFLEEVYI